MTDRHLSVSRGTARDVLGYLDHMNMLVGAFQSAASAADRAESRAADLKRRASEASHDAREWRKSQEYWRRWIFEHEARHV